MVGECFPDHYMKMDSEVPCAHNCGSCRGCPRRTASIIEIDARIRLPSQAELSACLVDGDIDAIRVKHFADLETCQKLTIAAVAASQPHAAVEGLGIDGKPFYLASKNGKLADEYFAYSGVFSAAVRRYANGTSPLDAVLGAFGQMHRGGIRPASLEDGRVMPAGIFRCYPAEKGTDVRPHEDILHWEVESDLARGFLGQGGWNLYTDMPAAGGELVLYGFHLDEREFRDLAKGDYALQWETAGDPLACLTPEVGELIIINSRHLHAVRKSAGDGYRTTLSGFVAYTTSGLMPWA